MNVLLWAGVMLIGGAGSVVRFLADGVVAAAAGRGFPLGTLAVNVSGAVILGLITGLALGHDQALLAGTAAVGSYTTFSTWMLETQRLTEERQHRTAALNVVASLALGIAAAGLGHLLGAQPVTADCLKLTSYFGERHRSGGSFTADALIELYGRHEIAASILLRGTEGFGLKHHLRTDRSLTLSEDLPLTAIAVDTRSRIEAVLPQTVQLTRTGLVTLERARLLTDVTGPGWSPEDLHETTKLTIYLGRQERAGRVPAFVAVCDLLHRRGIDGATALLGVDGTAHGRRERAAFFSRNAEVPMMVIAVGSGGADRQRPARTRRAAAAPAAHPRTRPHLQAGRPAPRHPAGPARRRRARHGAVAQAHGLHLRSGPAPRGADPPCHRPPAAFGGAQRRHHPARHLGLPRRPRAARRPSAATGPPRPRRHDRHRHAGTDFRGVFGHRRAHQRARARHQRDHPRHAGQRRRPPARGTRLATHHLPEVPDPGRD